MQVAEFMANFPPLSTYGDTSSNGKTTLCIKLIINSSPNDAMEFSRQEYWSGKPFPSPDLPNPGIELGSPALQADSLPAKPPGKPDMIHESP